MRNPIRAAAEISTKRRRPPQGSVGISMPPCAQTIRLEFSSEKTAAGSRGASGERFLPNRAYLTPDINFLVGLTSSAKTTAAAKGTRALIPNSRGSGIEA